MDSKEKKTPVVSTKKNVKAGRGSSPKNSFQKKAVLSAVASSQNAANAKTAKLRTNMPCPERATTASFWETKTVEELAKEQGIKPVKDISELMGYWPDGADFDAFYEAAVTSRKHVKND